MKLKSSYKDSIIRMYTYLKSTIVHSILIMIIGYFLISLTYMIPNNLLDKNVKESAEILVNEGLYPKLTTNGTYVDNWADADCLAVAYNRKGNNIFYNGLDAFQEYSSQTENKWGTNNLLESVNDNADMHMDHSYLWHGFRIFLRPLLIVLNIRQIRTIMATIALFLLVDVCINISKIAGAVHTFIFLFVWGINGFHMETVSVLFFVDLIISLVAIRWILSRADTLDTANVFCVCGSLVAFFSMFVTPFLTFGLPIVIYLIIEIKRHDRTAKENIAKYCINGFSWAIGYGFVLETKIVLSKIFFTSDNGLSQVGRYFAVGEQALEESRIDRLIIILKRFWEYNSFAAFIILVSIATSIFLFICKKNKNDLSTVFLLGITGILPIAWILVFIGHSHHGFTIFNFSISLYTYMECVYILSEDELKKYFVKSKFENY